MIYRLRCAQNSSHGYASKTPLFDLPFTIDYWLLVNWLLAVKMRRAPLLVEPVGFSGVLL